jgi:DNA-binding response OmpR family regulator
MDKNKICVMLIDDNYDDNFFHERVIKKSNVPCTVITKNTASDALIYLKSIDAVSVRPDLVFLDINMPGMNGWEFLKEYEKLDKEFRGKAVVVMLTTSDNIDDVARSKGVTADYHTKPLTTEKFLAIVKKYFTVKL